MQHRMEPGVEEGEMPLDLRGVERESLMANNSLLEGQDLGSIIKRILKHFYDELCMYSVSYWQAWDPADRR